MCAARELKMQKWATGENVQMISNMNCISEFESCQIYFFYLKMCHSIDDVDTLKMTTIDAIIIIE